MFANNQQIDSIAQCSAAHAGPRLHRCTATVPQKLGSFVSVVTPCIICSDELPMQTIFGQPGRIER